jgi:hypothetical protein
MDLKQRLPLLNSTVAFVLAGFVVTTIHEVSHLVASLILGHPATIYPNIVDSGNRLSSHDGIIIAGTGPLFSLVTGLLVILLVRTTGWRSGFLKLFVLWFGFLSAETGFGYLFIAPIVPNGDTGEVLALLHAQWYVYAIVFLIGIGGFVFLLPRIFAARFSPFAADKKGFFQLGMWPWLYGTIILLVLYFLAELTVASVVPGAPVIFVLVGVATIGIFTPIANYRAGAVSEALPLRMPITGGIVTVIVALLIILLLARGVPVG